MKKLSVVLSLGFALVWGNTVLAQNMPAGVLVSTVDCKLNAGITMPQAVAWARNQPRNGPQPGLEFYRFAQVNAGFLENYDFRIAQYFQGFDHMVQVVSSTAGMPANRVQPAVRATDLYTCDPATRSVATNRTVNTDNDGFTGQVTLMHTRFCVLEEGETLADAWNFVRAVNANYREAGNNSLMQLYNREIGPVGNMQIAGRGVVIAAVPATVQDWGQRMDMGRDGFRALEGVTSPFAACNYPAVWLTHATYRSQQAQAQ